MARASACLRENRTLLRRTTAATGRPAAAAAGFCGRHGPGHGRTRPWPVGMRCEGRAIPAAEIPWELLHRESSRQREESAGSERQPRSANTPARRRRSPRRRAWREGIARPPGALRRGRLARSWRRLRTRCRFAGRRGAPRAPSARRVPRRARPRGRRSSRVPARRAAWPARRRSRSRPRRADDHQACRPTGPGGESASIPVAASSIGFTLTIRAMSDSCSLPAGRDPMSRESRS